MMGGLGPLAALFSPALMGMFSSPLSFLSDAYMPQHGGFPMGGLAPVGNFGGYPSRQSMMPSPESFWPGNNVYNHTGPEGTRSHTFGGHYSENGQANHGGHAFQTMNNGVGTDNRQLAIGGSAYQQIQAGFGSRNTQAAEGVSEQRINSNGGVSNLQVHGGQGRGHQVSRSNGHGSLLRRLATVAREWTRKS